MIKVQDIQCNDYTLYKQFLDYWNRGQYSAAIRLLMDGQLVDKAAIANLFNTLFNDISRLEYYYYDGVEQELLDSEQTFGGRVAQLNKRTVYDEDTVYTKGNVVAYNDNLYCYIYSVPSSGNLPTDTTYWLLLNITGDKGAAGVGLNLRYGWASNVNYQPQDVVYYSGAVYYATQDNVDTVPSPISPYWNILFTLPKGEMEFGATVPDRQYYGQLWLKQL